MDDDDDDDDGLLCVLGGCAVNCTETVRTVNGETHEDDVGVGVG